MPDEVPRSQTAELRALLATRDSAVRLLELESASAENTPFTERRRAQLTRQRWARSADRRHQLAWGPPESEH
jgi:hypothetical protein